MKAFQTFLRWTLSFLMAAVAFISITGGQAAAQGSPIASANQDPVPVRPLLLFIPHDIRHLVHQDDTASVILRIGMDGRVLDWVPLDLPHRRLLGALDRAFAEAVFLPAIQDGEVVPVDVVVKVPVGEAVRNTVLSVSQTELLESRMSEINPNMHRFHLSYPGQLDEPLELIGQGNPPVPVDEAGIPVPGEVMVEFYIDPEGIPRLVRPMDTASAQLWDAAFLTVEGLRFAPPSRKGRPTVVKARIPVVFGQ